jgi:NAD(P)-dependent dehydrogenase (short-subunit alcohol dehydrogenase family)
MFEGKVAQVTGGASGIGRAAALLYAQNGASVVVSDVNDEGGRETVQLIIDNGGTADYFHCNVAEVEDCEALIQHSVNTFGALDIAFNNAGVGGVLQGFDKYPLDDWARTIAINLSGIFYCMRAELQVMQQQETGGAIVNTASILGQIGSGLAPAYVASKHGVVGLTKSAALHVARRNIRVNCVGPGYIETPMMEVQPQWVKETSLRLHPVGRKGQPEEVAELVIWLSSDKASFVTGSYHPVDGGYLAL